MASEHATPDASQPNQPPSIHEAAPDGRNIITTTSSGTRSSGGDPFASNSGSQSRRDPLPQEADVRDIAQIARADVPQSPTGVAERHGYANADSVSRQDMPMSQIPQSRLGEYQTQTTSRPLPPSPPGVRLADTEFQIPYRPIRARTLSTDPTNRLSGAPLSSHLSRNPSRLVAPDDRGEVFYNEKHLPVVKGSIQDRLSKTIESAQTERDKYAARASTTGLALNVAIGLQVLLGSLVTGLSAVATKGHSAAVSTTILGALATLVASYLARARGSNEPELSITRVKDLEHFIRDCNNFRDDHANYVGHEFDDQIETFRCRFEELLGNANGERKLSPPGP